MSSAESVPLVTLALTTFNGTRTLERALDSLAGQTWPNIEILISDDGSQDETVALCRAFAARHDNVRLFTHEHNLGWFGYRNIQFLTDHARGDYIAWVCQDDYWDKDFVKNQVEAIESTPRGVAAVCAHGMFSRGQHDAVPEEWRTHSNYWPQNNGRFRNFKHAMRRTIQNPTRQKLITTFVIHCLVRADVFREAIASVVGPSEGERQFAAYLSMLGTCAYVDKIDCYKGVSRIDERSGSNDVIRANLAHMERNNTIADCRLPLHRYVAGFIKAVWRSRLMSVEEKATGTVFILYYFFNRLPGRCLQKFGI